jgi:hypothetical protein
MENVKQHDIGELASVPRKTSIKKYDISLEAIIIYSLILFYIVVFFNDIKAILYQSLAYIAFLMFLSVIVVQILYVCFTIAKIIYDIILVR